MRTTTMALVLMILCAAQPLCLAPRASASETSEVAGRIFQSDGKTPAEGVHVRLYHLSSGRLYESGPTDAKGAYRIQGLPHGYFDMAVVTPQGPFVTDQVVHVAPKGRTVTNMTIRASDDDDEGTVFPGTSEPSAGVATVSSKGSAASFWTSPKGVTVIVGAGALGLLAVAGSGSDDPPASPSTP